jgi:hypothetical protein
MKNKDFNDSQIKPRLTDTAGMGRYLNVSYWSAREILLSGALPYVVLKKRRLVDIRDLDALIEKNKETAA